MATCEVCGNEYDESFEIHIYPQRHMFDSFECAIHALAPKCSPTILHGVEVGNRMFGSAHRAEASGESNAVKDRAA